MTKIRVQLFSLPKLGVFMTCFYVVLCTVFAAQSVIAENVHSSEHNRRLVTEAFDQWQAGTGGLFETLLSPDVVWTIKGSQPSAGDYIGRDDFIERAVRPFVARLAKPLTPTSKQIWADGDTVVVNFDAEGLARDGLPYRNSYVWILRMHKGLAVEVTAFLDLAPYEDVLSRIPLPSAT